MPRRVRSIFRALSSVRSAPGWSGGQKGCLPGSGPPAAKARAAFDQTDDRRCGLGLAPLPPCGFRFLLDRLWLNGVAILPAPRLFKALAVFFRSRRCRCFAPSLPAPSLLPSNFLGGVLARSGSRPVGGGLAAPLPRPVCAGDKMDGCSRTWWTHFLLRSRAVVLCWSCGPCGNRHVARDPHQEDGDRNSAA